MTGAWDAGVARAEAACAAAVPALTTEVTLDVGRGERRHITWCLTCQTAAARCPCGRDLVEPFDDALADVASLIADTRDGLARFGEAADALVEEVGADA